MVSYLRFTRPHYLHQVTGGCHAHNAMLLVKGMNEDYDHWESLGNSGWGWSDMRSALKDHVSYFPDLYMVDNSRPLMTPILQSLVNAGYSYTPDPVFGNRQSGVTNRRFTLQYQGIDRNTSLRQTTFTQYINHKISSMNNLDVRTTNLMYFLQLICFFFKIYKSSLCTTEQ